MSDSIPRFTDFFGYSAETSTPNESPQWGHLTSRFADEAQTRFEKWLNRRDHEQYLRGVQAARGAVSSAVPYNFELNRDGTEDKLRAAYVEGAHDAWIAIGELL